MDKRLVFAKKRLVTAVASMLAVMVLPESYAADVDKSAADEKKPVTRVEMDEIVVTGQALANRLSVQAKRDRDQILEAVSQDDLGQLPDHNMGDALGRVAGVSTVLDEGVGRYVTIRGLDPEFVKVTFDNLSLSSTAAPWDGNMNATNLEALPSAMVARIEVIKSVSADMDGDAIGGTVNAVTRSAFDAREKTFLSTHLAGGKYNQDEVPITDNDYSYRGDVTFSTLFGANDQFGVVLNANYRLIDTDYIKTLRTSWHDDGSGVFVPQDYWNYLYKSETEKKGVTAKFEYRPSDALQAFISANYFSDMRDWDRFGFRIHTRNQEDGAGSFGPGNARAQHFQTTFGTDGAMTWAGGVDWRPTDTAKLSAKATTSTSRFVHDNPSLQMFTADNNLQGTYSIAGSQGLPRYDLNTASDAYVEDPNNYVFNFADHKDEDYEKSIDELRLDWADNIEMGSYGFGYKVGVKWRSTTYEQDQFLEQYRTPYTGTTDLTQFLQGSDYTAPGMTNNAVFADAAGFHAWLQEHKSEFTVLTFNNRSDYKVTEDVAAGYAMGVYAGDQYRVVFGVRYEATDWNADTRLDGQEDAPIVTRKGDYNHVLPSLSLNYDLTESLKLRLAYSETIGRPDGADLAAINSDPDEDGNFRQANPNLEPRESDNYDVALEYYFDQGDSMLAVGYFRKDIANEIFNTQTTYSYTRPDGTINDSAIITQPTNAGDAEVQGFEISFVKGSLDFLPAPFDGLGMQLNWTHIDGEMSLVDGDGSVIRTVDRLKNQPDDTYNAALFYEKDALSMRLAYKFMGANQHGFDTTPDASGYYDGDQVWQDYKQLDFHIDYDVNANLNVFADFWNITDEDQFRTYGDDRYFENVDYGRSIWIGLNYAM